MDYSEYGGAPLLGVKGVCIICHGGSNPNAIKNAIRVAAEFSAGKVNEKIERELAAASQGNPSKGSLNHRVIESSVPWIILADIQSQIDSLIRVSRESIQ